MRAVHVSFTLAAAFAAAMLASGCGANGPVSGDPSKMRERPRLEVVVDREVINLELSASQQLAPAARARLGRAVRRQDPERVHVAVRPRGLAGAKASAIVSETLRRLGVPADNITRLPATLDAINGVEVRLRTGRLRYPDCPDWRRPSALSAPGGSSNFGCASAVNLGRMLADPLDIKRGRSLAPAPAGPAVRALGNGDKGSPASQVPRKLPSLQGRGRPTSRLVEGE